MQGLIDDPPTLIEFTAVTKVYGSGDAAVHALAGADLKIQAREFVAIMGPSGSGKSTAMNIIGCLDTPSSGSYLFEGIDVGSLRRDQRALLRRHFLGFVFQGFNLLPRTSAIENVELPLVYRGMAFQERRELASRALDRVGLKGRENHTANQLSGGQQQRVAIARAIVTNPAVLLADEPTGNLDAELTIEIMDLIAAAASRGTTVLVASHDLALVQKYARRVIGFLDGRIASDVTNKEAA